MGRVFSWKEVRDKCMPARKDFPPVVRDVREVLSVCEGIIGAVLCGAVQRGDWTVRSDIDCLVVYEPSDRLAVIDTLRKLVLSALERHIPIEFIPVDAELANRGLHHIDLFFFTHLLAAMKTRGGVVKANPLGHLRFNNREKLLDLQSYLRYKLRRLDHDTAGLGASVEARCLFLSKILSDPIHVARRMLQYREMLPSDDGKASVIHAYSSAFPTSLWETLRTLHEADKEYTASLAEQIRSPNERTYRATLQKVESLSALAYEFVRGNTLLLNALPPG